MASPGFLESITASAQNYKSQTSSSDFTNHKLSGDKRMLYGFNKRHSEPELKLPSIVKTNNDEMTHHFQFMTGQNDVQSRAKITGENTLVQQTSITLEGVKYHFLTTLRYDGRDFESHVMFNWTDVYEFAKTEQESNFDKWQFCQQGSHHTTTRSQSNDHDLVDDNVERTYDVWIQMATSLHEANDWAYPNSELKTQIYIDNRGTYYRTFIDLHTMTLVSNFYYDNQLLGRAEWQFSNTTWHNDFKPYSSGSLKQNELKNAHLSNTTYDPTTGSSLAVQSRGASDQTRNYTMSVDNAFTMESQLSFEDAWTFEQLVLIYEDLDKNMTSQSSIRTRIQFTGEQWSQSIEWGANDQLNYTNISFAIGTGEIFKPEYSWFESPNSDLFLWQDLDIKNAKWTATIGSHKTGLIFNSFDLNSGTWQQEFFGQGVQLWSDIWDTSGTQWNYQKPIQTQENPLRQLKNNAQQEDLDGGSCSLIVTSALLSLSIFGIAYFRQRNKFAAQQRVF